MRRRGVWESLATRAASTEPVLVDARLAEEAFGPVLDLPRLLAEESHVIVYFSRYNASLPFHGGTIRYDYNRLGATAGVKIDCGCRCMRCRSSNLESVRVGEVEDDGYFDMHHTCAECGAHFDHLEGVVFKACDACGYES